MIDRGLVSEDTAILAWLRAEFESPRFSPGLLASLNAMPYSRVELIDRAKLDDADQNRARKKLIETTRGYGANTLLFVGFPTDVTWRHWQMTPALLGKCRFARVPPQTDPTLNLISGGSFTVADGARTLREGVCPPGLKLQDWERFVLVKQQVEAGKRFPALIAARDGHLPKIVLLEGHTRATAYVATGKPALIDIFIGTGKGMSQWVYY